MAKGRGTPNKPKGPPRRRRRSRKRAAKLLGVGAGIHRARVERVCTVLGPPEARATYVGSDVFNGKPGSCAAALESWWIFGLKLASTIISFFLTTPMPTEWTDKEKNRRNGPTAQDYVYSTAIRNSATVAWKPIGTGVSFLIGLDECLCDSNLAIQPGQSSVHLDASSFGAASKENYWPFIQATSGWNPDLFHQYVPISWSRGKVNSLKVTINSSVKLSDRVGQLYVGFDDLPYDDTSSVFDVIGQFNKPPSKDTVMMSPVVRRVPANGTVSYTWRPRGAWTGMQEVGMVPFSNVEVAGQQRPAAFKIDPARGLAGGRPFLKVTIYFEAFAGDTIDATTKLMHEGSNTWKMSLVSNVELTGKTENEWVPDRPATNRWQWKQRFIRKHFVQSFPWNERHLKTNGDEVLTTYRNVGCEGGLLWGTGVTGEEELVVDSPPGCLDEMALE